MGKEIDFTPIIDGIRLGRGHFKPGDMSRVYAAIESLRDMPFPAAYLDGVRDELLGFIKNRPSARHYAAHVYLAFYGTDGRASFLKVGIAKDVRHRLASHATSNPLPNLWTFTAGFDQRSQAASIESALLKHLTVDRVHGEWINVHGLSEDAAKSFAESLAEVASQARGLPVKFARSGV